jgi:hypothetical protein
MAVINIPNHMMESVEPACEASISVAVGVSACDTEARGAAGTAGIAKLEMEVTSAKAVANANRPNKIRRGAAVRRTAAVYHGVIWQFSSIK